MNLVNCKASKPSNEPKKKKKGGGGVFLHWCAMHSGKIAHTHFQTLSKPQQHTERSHVCLTLIILLQKKKGGGNYFERNKPTPALSATAY